MPNAEPDPTRPTLEFLKPQPRAADLVRRHMRLFEDRFGDPYPVNWPKDVGIMGRLVTSLPYERLVALQDSFFKLPSADWAVREGGLSIAVFAAQVPKLIARVRAETVLPCLDTMDFRSYCRWKRGRGPEDMTLLIREKLREEWEAMHQGDGLVEAERHGLVEGLSRE